MIALALALLIIPFFLAQGLPPARSSAVVRRLILTSLFLLGLLLLTYTLVSLLIEGSPI